MARPKGTKNKPKADKAKEPVVTTPVEPVAPMPTKPHGHGVTVKEEFNPKPDMGTIKPPADGAKLCECLHRKDIHYGPSVDWCNTGGCQCQNFNAK